MIWRFVFLGFVLFLLLALYPGVSVRFFFVSLSLSSIIGFVSLSLSSIIGHVEKKICCFLHNQQRLWLSDSICFLLLIFVVFLLTGNASTPPLCCIFRVLLSRRDTTLIPTSTLQPMRQSHRVLRTQSSRLTMPLTSMSPSLFLDATFSTKSPGAPGRTDVTKIRKDTDKLSVAAACTVWLQSG
jgi:hypothetical protein